jgi:enoyl-CoA hydratase
LKWEKIKEKTGNMMSSDVVQYEKEGRLGIITINRPQVRNALNMPVFYALDEILDGVSRDEEVRALVITGSDNGFVAGADINELSEHTMMGGWTACRFQQSVFTKLERIGKPSIAAIRGFCLGGGLELALSCTFRVASVKAKIGFPELGLGIIPGFGGTERTVRTIGYAKAAEMILCQSVINGKEAFRIGLINEAVECDDEVLGRAKEWAQNLASLSPVAMRLELELLLQGQGSTIDQGLALESALGAMAVTSKEAKELLGKFLEKKR